MTSLHSEQALFRSLVDASPMPTAIYTGEDIIISMANQGMLDFWGKDQSVIGRPLAEAVPELKDQPFMDLLKQVYTTGVTHHALEDKADLIIDGKLQSFYFTYTYRAFRNAEGQISAIIHTAADVTELVQARQKIAETEEHLSFALSSAGIGIWDLDP
ncbi:MAG TPA: PAS domain-containing protein, partial [Pedobacter sp.]